MPHEIEQHDTMVSGGGIIPWHRLGTVVQDLPYDDVLRLAGLDWEVELRPVFAAGNAEFDVDALRSMRDDPGMNMVPVYAPMALMPADQYQAVVRHNLSGDEPDRVISIVGSDYQVLQNAHGLEFLRILMDAGDIQVETAGSLRNNRIVWVCAKMDRNITIGGDETVPYLVFRTSHDGSMAAGVTAGPVRVVCANTLRMSELQANRSWQTTHVGDITGRVAEARQALAMGTRFYDAFEQEVNALMAQAVTDRKFEVIVKACVPIEDGMSERQTASRNARRDQIRLHWIGEPDTAWAALNAVNHYELWDRTVRGADAEARTDRRATRQAMTVLRGRQRLTDRAHAILLDAR
jgi:phage/plasmid-like protein (TIGR03299 family)